MHKGHSASLPAWLALSTLASPSACAGTGAEDGRGGGPVWRVTHGRWAGLPYHNAAIGTSAGDKNPLGFPSALWKSEAARTGGSPEHRFEAGNGRFLESLSRGGINDSGGSNETMAEWRARREAYGASFVRTAASSVQQFEAMTVDPNASQTAFYCVRYRCNRDDECSGRGDPSAVLDAVAAGAVAYWPNCGVCVCDDGYSGARCETFSDSFDILTQHRTLSPVTYAEAAAACEALGETLAPLRSEAQWAKLMLATGPMLSADQSCWMGARAAAGEGVWRWHPSPHSRLGGAVLSNERVLAFAMFAPWLSTDYSMDTTEERLMKIKTVAPPTAVGTPPNATGNAAIFYTTNAQPTERLACYYCARFLCNNDEDCHGNAESVSGVWPDCKCVCRGGLPLIGHALKEWMAGDCRTRTVSATSTTAISFTASVNPSATASATASLSVTVTESASLSESRFTQPQTPSVTLPPLVEPPPPRVGATSTLSTVGFGARYTHYSPIRPLVGTLGSRCSSQKIFGDGRQRRRAPLRARCRPAGLTVSQQLRRRPPTK